MNLYTQLPDAFHSDKVHFVDAFQEIATLLGDSKESAQELFSLLPQDIKFAPAFFFLLTKKWCYEFGLPFDRLPQNQIVFGLEQFPLVENLYAGMKAANKHLKSSQLLSFLERLGNPSKHQETLAELAPLVRLHSDVSAQYEVAGYGQGNRTIDWLFSAINRTPVLMDVKYRIKDLIEHLSEMIPDLNAGKRQFPPPEISPQLLFKDTVDRFISKDPDLCLQGVWIHSHVKQKESELRQYFFNLDTTRLPFAIFCRWTKNAYVICRPDVNEQCLADLFGVNFSQ